MDLAERIRVVNATTTADDPGYNGAVEISLRFSAWMSAARTQRESSDGDLAPELHTILELSRERPDSVVMRHDLCRVASFYLHEWAGITPLPTDPAPR